MYKTLLEQVHAGDYQPAIKIDKGRNGYEEYWEGAKFGARLILELLGGELLN